MNNSIFFQVVGGTATLGGVTLIDIRGAVRDESAIHTRVIGVRVTHLTEDDRVDLSTGKWHQKEWLPSLQRMITLTLQSKKFFI